MQTMLFTKRSISIVFLMFFCTANLSASKGIAWHAAGSPVTACPIEFVPCGQVQLSDLFWRKRLHAIADVSLPAMLCHAPKSGSRRQAFLADVCAIAENLRAFDPDNASVGNRADSLRALLKAWKPMPDNSMVIRCQERSLSLTGDRLDAEVSSLSDALNQAETDLRLFCQTGDGRHIDRFERTLYNSLLCSFQYTGNSYYTVTPRQGQPLPSRRPWSGGEGDVVRLTRLLSGITGYFCATSERHVYVNFFTRGTVSVSTDSLCFSLFEQASYPWAGDAGLAVMCREPQRFTLHLRVPQWLAADSIEETRGCRYLGGNRPCILYVNGQRISAPVVKGYLTIDRQWSDSDFVVVRFPMEIRRIANAEGTQRALQRGPFVYAIEDSVGCLQTCRFNERQTLHTEFRLHFLDNVQIISGTLTPADADAPPQPFTAIPYYAIGSRDRGETFGIWMNVQR